MRLSALCLRRYGNFDAAELELDPAPGRINLVVAPNGAGKSVLRQAFGDLLFGIGGQTPMGFRHGYEGMQLLARGIGPDGAPFGFGRRKGQGNTLLAADGTPGDPAALAQLLGRADRALLDQLFALDTERLRRGGADLLESGGALADALLAAAGGLREAQGLRRRLEEERDKLAPPRKLAQRPFYAALDRWTAHRRTLRDAILRPDRWAEGERELDAARETRRTAQALFEAAAEAIRAGERLRRVRPLLHRLDAAEGWLRDHPDAPHLPPELAEELPAARAAQAAAAAACDAAAAQHAALVAQAAAIRPDAAILARLEEIAALAGAAGAAERAREELPEVERAQAATGAAAERLLRALGLDLSPEQAPGAVPPRATLARARRLIAEAGSLAEAAAPIPARLADAERRLAAAAAALEALPEAADGDGLAALLLEISRDGEPTRLAAAARRALEEAEAARRLALAALPPALRAEEPPAPLPDPDALERRAAALAAAGAAGRAAAADAAREAEALAAAAAQLDALRVAGPLPDAAAVAAARAHRDRGWALLAQQLAGGAPPDPAAAVRFAGPAPLPLAFERAVAAADAVADRRAAETERVAQAAALEHRIEGQRAALARAEAAAAAAEAALAAARTGWAAALAPLGLEGDAELPEARRVLAARDAALGAIRAEASARAAAAELAQRQAAEARRLLPLLHPAPPATHDLRALLDAAEARQRAAQAATLERGRQRAARDAAAEALDAARRDRDALAARRTAWAAEWAALLPELHRPAGEHPEDTAAVLELLEELTPPARRLAEARARAAELRAEGESFAAACRALCAALAPDLDPGAPFAAARELDRRGREQAGRQQSRALLLEQAAAAAAALDAARDALGRAEAGLRDVLARSGAATAEEAERRIALAVERARHAAARDAALAELFEAGDGLPPEALRRAAAEQPPEAADAALAEAREAQARHGLAAQEAAAAATRLEEAMKRLAGDDAALVARAGEENASAAMGAALDDALLLQTAASLLDAALATVGEAGDDRLLRRVGDSFAALTEDAFSGVASHEDGRGQARLFLRGPHGEVAVDGLSEGTRDALFLALRLVAIEDHLEGGVALPFLGDDILQTFDDRRAAAAFRVLLGFSERVQVILLTHHPHLAELARATLPPGTLFLREIAPG
ncbi:AAA family ATPase [Roseomonas sp. BN140053]|uniref:AAA family ATPase n=1 Tax=Roseomonas sp. BN140053 TaxID=3391898 RepID=UPI0039EADC48